MASSITYKNLFFPTTGNDIGNTNGFLTYCEYTDEMVELSQGPNFKVYEHNNIGSGLKIYGVYLELIAFNAGKPVYRLYDAYDTNYAIRCWGFWNLWVNSAGEIVYDENDHTLDNWQRINYINSDWLFIDSDGFIKARIRDKDDKEYKDFLHSDRLGSPTDNFYQLGVIQDDINPDDEGEQYAGILLPFDTTENLKYVNMIKPLDINTDVYNFSSRVFDYAVQSTVNEEYLVPYPLKDANSTTDNYLNFTFDFGYDIKIRDLNSVGNDETNLIADYKVSSIKTYEEKADELYKKYSNGFKKYTENNYSFTWNTEYYYTDIKPIMEFNGTRYTINGLDDNSLNIIFNLYKNNDYLKFSLYDSKILANLGKWIDGLSLDGFNLYYVKKITKDNCLRPADKNHIGEYKLARIAMTDGENLLMYIEKRKDGFCYYNDYLNDEKGASYKIVTCRTLQGGYYESDKNCYFLNDPIATGWAKPLKHIYFSCIPKDIWNNAIDKVPLLQRTDLKCIFELDEYKKFNFGDSNWTITSVFNDNSTKIHEVTIDKNNKLPFVVPFTPSYYYDTTQHSNNVPFIEYVLKNYTNEIMNLHISDDGTKETVNKTMTKYIQDSVIRGASGYFWTRLIDPHTPDDDKTVEEIIEEEREKNSQYWITPMDFYANINSDQIHCSDDGTGYYKFGDNTENDPNYFWVNTLRNWCSFKIDENDNVILTLWNGRSGWDKLEDILNCEKPKEIARKYMYNKCVLIEGPSIANYPVSQHSLTIRTDKKWKTWYGTTRHTQLENREPSENAPFIKKSIRLYEDTKFSYHDNNTYQTIKPAKMYLDDIMKRYVWPIGCPLVERLPSGELNLIYRLALFGVDSKPVFSNEIIKFLNSICIAYFGDGRDKMIDDWKKYWKIDLSEEVPSEEILTEDTDTLFNQDIINTNVVTNNNSTITFKMPMQYPSTDNITNADYAERWEK